jgi:acetyl esterase/lipase
MMYRSLGILLLITCFFPVAGQAQEFTTVTYYSDLDMDIYIPRGEIKGIVLYVHGGGFSGGSRRDGITFCENVTELNYAAITMSYRLLMAGKGFGCDVPAEEKRRVFLEAGRDISRATAWILKNRDLYDLPVENIILAGSSAGAEAVLHAAYWDKTRLNAKGENILPPDFTYQGVISMAGALIDSKLITKESAIPTQLFHGTCDPLVPYATAPHHYCEETEPGYLMLHGSSTLANRLKELKQPYSLITECGGGHEWAGEPLDNYFQYVANFLAGEFPIEVIEGEVECDYGEVEGCLWWICEYRFWSSVLATIHAGRLSGGDDAEVASSLSPCTLVVASTLRPRLAFTG